MSTLNLTAEDGIRPQSWDDYVGQHQMKAKLDIMIKAAIRDRRALDHMLLIASPGAGKTSLGSLIADRLGDDFFYLKMPMETERFFDFVEEHNEGVIFLDEIHNAPKAFQEMLQPALEDGKIITKENWVLDVSKICFIGATTTSNREKILEPLRDRFGIKPVWAGYEDEEMMQIITGMGRRLGVEIPDVLAKGLARAAGGTPRLAKPLVKAARDLIEPGAIVTAEDVLDLVGIDEDGLEHAHLEYLRVLKSLGGDAGLRNLCSILRMSNSSIEELERLLAVRGYVRLKSTGRKLTPEGRAKLTKPRTDSRLAPTTEDS